VKRAMLVVPVVTSLMLFGAAFAPAQASFQDDVINAATNMIERSDVPKALGTMGKSTGFTFEQPQPQAILCFKAEEILITGKYSQQAIAFFSLGNSNTVAQNIMQFKRPKAAAKSFAQLAKDIRKCNGTQTNSTQNTDGSTFTSSQVNSTGTLKTASAGGRKPVFLLNSVSTSGQYESGQRFDAGYTVYSLAKNVISAITHQPKIGVNLTNKTQKAVDQLSLKAAARWVS
jgi:hypothetical protein